MCSCYSWGIRCENWNRRHLTKQGFSLLISWKFNNCKVIEQYSWQLFLINDSYEALHCGQTLSARETKGVHQVISFRRVLAKMRKRGRWRSSVHSPRDTSRDTRFFAAAPLQRRSRLRANQERAYTVSSLMEILTIIRGFLRQKSDKYYQYFYGNSTFFLYGPYNMVEFDWGLD